MKASYLIDVIQLIVIWYYLLQMDAFMAPVLH